MSPKRNKADAQSDKFKRLAREVGADEDEDAFKDKLRRIAAQLPKKKPEKGDD